MSTTDAKSTSRWLIHLFAVGSRRIAASIAVLLVGSAIAATATGCGGEQSADVKGGDNASNGASSGGKQDDLERAMGQALASLHGVRVLSVRCDDLDRIRMTNARCAVTSRNDDGRISEQIYDVEVKADDVLNAEGEDTSFFWCCVGGPEKPDERSGATPPRP